MSENENPSSNLITKLQASALDVFKRNFEGAFKDATKSCPELDARMEAFIRAIFMLGVKYGMETCVHVMSTQYKLLTLAATDIVETKLKESLNEMTNN